MSTLLEYKCPCCNGELVFNSDIQKMKCPYCDTEFEMETLKAYDEELKNNPVEEMVWDEEAPENWDVPEGMVAYKCESCAGQVITDTTTAASRCPYCDNPIVMVGKVSGVLKPDYVIPFKHNKEAAVKAFSNHLKGKILLPKSFKSESHINEIKGVYVPFWFFDCDTDSNFTYRATKVRHWSSGSYRYTETSYYLLTRGGKLGFDKVPVDGSSKMADDLMDSLEPYDYKGLVDFQTAYLAGFLADKYDVEQEASKERANTRIRQSTTEAFRKTVVGYATCVTENNSVKLSHGKIKYALLPVWILNTVYRGEKYVFAMNGQTGKFVGNLPADKGAFARWFAGVFAGVTAVAGLVAMLLGGVL